jgi:hypothetical protein
MPRAGWSLTESLRSFSGKEIKPRSATPLRSYQMMMALHEAGENLRNNPAASA